MKEDVEIFDALQQLHDRMDISEKKDRKTGILKIFVTATLPVSVLTVLLFISLSNFSKTSTELRTSVGATTSIVLSDGTKVDLNSNSTLSYPRFFFGKHRKVYLHGEAFFDVAPQGIHDFTVVAKDVEIKVHGTAFNVEAYSPDDVRTTLFRGSISLVCPFSDSQKRELFMDPGEGYAYNASAKALFRIRADYLLDTSWKEGKIVLDKTPLSSALREIGNTYNVEFVIKDKELLDNLYTGTFAGQRLDVVLSFFEQTSNVKFEENYSGPSDGQSALTGRQIISVTQKNKLTYGKQL